MPYYSIASNKFLVYLRLFLTGSSPISLTAVNLFLWMVIGPKLVLFIRVFHKDQSWVLYSLVCTSIHFVNYYILSTLTITVMLIIHRFIDILEQVSK